jgi:hypothetical protein
MSRLPVDVVREWQRTQLGLRADVASPSDDDKWSVAASYLDLEDTIAHEPEERVEEVHLTSDVEQGNQSDEDPYGQTGPEGRGIYCEERYQVRCYIR